MTSLENPLSLEEYSSLRLVHLDYTDRRDYPHMSPVYLLSVPGWYSKLRQDVLWDNTLDSKNLTWYQKIKNPSPCFTVSSLQNSERHLFRPSPGLVPMILGVWISKPLDWSQARVFLVLWMFVWELLAILYGFDIRSFAAIWSWSRSWMGTVNSPAKRADSIFKWQLPGSFNFKWNHLLINAPATRKAVIFPWQELTRLSL